MRMERAWLWPVRGGWRGLGMDDARSVNERFQAFCKDGGKERMDSRSGQMRPANHC